MKWILKRNLAGQLDYFNPLKMDISGRFKSAECWTAEPVVWFAMPTELISVLSTLFDYVPTIRWSNTLRHWEHQPCWDDDRYPLDISYTIEVSR